MLFLLEKRHNVALAASERRTAGRKVSASTGDRATVWAPAAGTGISAWGNRRGYEKPQKVRSADAKEWKTYLRYRDQRKMRHKPISTSVSGFRTAIRVRGGASGAAGSGRCKAAVGVASRREGMR